MEVNQASANTFTAAKNNKHTTALQLFMNSAKVPGCIQQSKLEPELLLMKSPAHWLLFFHEVSCELLACMYRSCIFIICGTEAPLPVKFDMPPILVFQQKRASLKLFNQEVNKLAF